ncbi:HU family DNA-binding protein [Nonomuraea sp. NPDC049269]|uniref:HU family DNA-binding protein n=1 Tax=Nonomuraea sp. NPDC049269 TaxID=3364349 RepID=UPI003714A6FF
MPGASAPTYPPEGSPSWARAKLNAKPPSRRSRTRSAPTSTFGRTRSSSRTTTTSSSTGARRTRAPCPWSSVGGTDVADRAWPDQARVRSVRSDQHHQGRTMNKTQVINAVTERADLDKADVSAVVGHIIAVIQDAVASGDKVAIAGFGSFEQVYKPARTARNPQTGAEVQVPESWAPKFRPGSEFKELVNEGGKTAATEQAA